MLEPETLTQDPSLIAGANVSKLFRKLAGYDWQHVNPTVYKDDESGHSGVTRRVFTGETGESADFHFRYFEINKGGFSTLEHHQHEHVVLVMRGSGHALVGDKRIQLGFGDVLYVAPNDVHQFSNSSDEPFGFFCVVNAKRDRPIPVEIGFGSSCD